MSLELWSLDVAQEVYHNHGLNNVSNSHAVFAMWLSHSCWRSEIYVPIFWTWVYLYDNINIEYGKSGARWLPKLDHKNIMYSLVTLLLRTQVPCCEETKLVHMDRQYREVICRCSGCQPRWGASLQPVSTSRHVHLQILATSHRVPLSCQVFPAKAPDIAEQR